MYERRIPSTCLNPECHNPVLRRNGRGKVYATARLYCSMDCCIQTKWSRFKSDPNSVWTSERRKKQLLEELGHQCQKCKNTTWNEIPITLEIEHIDGNSNDNSRENTTLLCPNCHSQTPTYKAKNKGNGRHQRRERYKSGLSF